MIDSSSQDSDSNIETLPMTNLGNKVLNSPKGETSRKKLENEDKIPLQSQQNQVRKVSWAGVRPASNGTAQVSGITNENVCPSCAGEPRNKSLYRTGRMSLPLTGKYADYYHSKKHGKTNGVCASTLIPHPPGVENGAKSHLNRFQSGITYCCDASLNRVFQRRDLEKPWKSKGNYFVAVVTYLLGVGNVVRFPQLCFKHGGGRRNDDDESRPRCSQYYEMKASVNIGIPKHKNNDSLWFLELL